MPKVKKSPPPAKKENHPYGSPLWFVAQLGPALRGPDSENLLAIGVRMSEADRRTMIKILLK